MYSNYIHVDPRYARVRYVGLTGDGFERFNQHLTEPKSNQRKQCWFQELQEEGEIVSMQIIDKASTLAEARRKEAFWIQFYLQFQQADLLNIQRPLSPFIDACAGKPIMGLLEIDLPQEHLSYQLDEMRKERISIWGQLKINSVLVFPGIAQATIYMDIHHPCDWAHIVTKWLKQRQHPSLFPCYRYHIWGMEWAAFGDQELLTRRLLCNEEGQDIPCEEWQDIH